ncbi:MAG: ankyrin repeat domain-containing protein [Phycisphaerales bacterium]
MSTASSTTPSPNRVPVILLIGFLVLVGGGLWYAVDSFEKTNRVDAAGPESMRPAPASSLHDLAAAGTLDDAAIAAAQRAGSDLNAALPTPISGERGLTPLMLASLRAKPNAVRALLKAKADPDLRSKEGKTALFFAAGWGGTDCVEALLSAKASVDARTDQAWSALMIAAARGEGACVDRLIEAGADVRARNRWGQTPLSLAAMHASLDVAKRLLKAGAPIADADNDGVTILAHAAKSPAGDENAIELLRLLLDSGANPNTPGVDGVTPLMWAADAADQPRILLLLNNGADANAKDKDGRTALDWASARDDDNGRAAAAVLKDAMR